MVRRDSRKLYTSVLDVDSSADGKVVYLTSAGEIGIFALPSSSSPHLSASGIALAEVGGKKLNCMRSISDALLACGTDDGKLLTYSWSQLGNLGNGTAISKTPQSSTNVTSVGINDVLRLSNGNELLIGCADGTMRLIDIEVIEKTVSSNKPHAQQINRIAQRGEHEVVSCANDGTVALCDLRTGRREPAKLLRISKEARVLREGYSRSIIALDVLNDLVICGGGVRLAAWHLPSESLVSLLSPDTANNGGESLPEPIYSDVKLVGGQILAGGFGCDKLYTFSHTYEPISTIRVPHSFGVNCIHPLLKGGAHHSQNTTLIAGQSPFIHFLSDLGYISASVALLHD